jgi:hypothetical protein
MTKKKVVIVGSGPGGLFAAYELAKSGKHDIKVIEKGKDIETRDSEETLSGIGGAGLYSDGKIIYHHRVGTFLPLVIGIEKVNELNDYVESIFKSHDIHVKELDKNSQHELDKLKTKAYQESLDFVVTRTAHVGTDKLVDLVRDLRNDLITNGVEFHTEEEVTQINKKSVTTNKKRHSFDYLILAPGRDGSEWLETIITRDFNMTFGNDYLYNPVDIGVRVEVKREITDFITNLSRDMKFYIKAGEQGRQVRTFCTCPGGKVAIEDHGEYKTVNGHSKKDDPYENTNFAFLVTIPFTEPQANGNPLARQIAKSAYILSAGGVLVQRFGDLIKEQRSKEKDVNEWFIQPSLKEAVPGDINLHMPKGYLEPLIDGLKKLGKVIPGIDSENTLFYSPEVKLHSLRLLTDEYLQTTRPNIYVAGDGPGLTRGIVAAAATGVLAARGILKR